MCWWQAFIRTGLSKLQLLNQGTAVRIFTFMSSVCVCVPPLLPPSTSCFIFVALKLCVRQSHISSEVPMTRPTSSQIIPYMFRAERTLIRLPLGVCVRCAASDSHDRHWAFGIQALFSACEDMGNSAHKQGHRNSNKQLMSDELDHPWDCN